MPFHLTFHFPSFSYLDLQEYYFEPLKKLFVSKDINFKVLDYCRRIIICTLCIGLPPQYECIMSLATLLRNMAILELPRYERTVEAMHHNLIITNVYTGAHYS